MYLILSFDVATKTHKRRSFFLDMLMRMLRHCKGRNVERHNQSILCTLCHDQYAASNYMRHEVNQPGIIRWPHTNTIPRRAKVFILRDIYANQKIWLCNRRKIMKILSMAICIIIMLGLAGASQYSFGTKVTSYDSDFGAPLRLYGAPNPGAAFSLGYWETGVVNGYDDTDVVYLHQGVSLGAAGRVLSNDVRLTPFGYLVAGSKVTPQDNDIGMQLNALVGTNIVWVNSHGGPGHDLDDSVYIHVGLGPNTVTNDVRLSDVSGLPPGSKVGNLDPDLPNAFAVGTVTTLDPIATAGLGGLIAPLASVRYIDNNGNGQYDYPDDIYLITALSPFPAVRVNDVRLSGPV